MCPLGSSYKNKCRCSFCREDKRITQARYRRRTAQRSHGCELDIDHVPAAPALKRITDAKANGATFAELAQMTGLKKNYLQSLSRSRPSRKQPVMVQRKTYDQIMRGIPEHDSRVFLPTSKVPRKKALQVSRSLSAQGWTSAHQQRIIENNTGMSGKFVQHIAEMGRRDILKKNEDLMLWLEKNIGSAVGPSKYAMTIMRNRGYFPTRHYNAYGNLVKATLSAEQKAILERVQS